MCGYKKTLNNPGGGAGINGFFGAVLRCKCSPQPRYSCGLRLAQRLGRRACLLAGELIIY